VSPSLILTFSAAIGNYINSTPTVKSDDSQDETYAPSMSASPAREIDSSSDADDESSLDDDSLDNESDDSDSESDAETMDASVLSPIAPDTHTKKRRTSRGRKAERLYLRLHKPDKVTKFKSKKSSSRSRRANTPVLPQNQHGSLPIRQKSHDPHERPWWVAKETPIPNPYLSKIREYYERDRRARSKGKGVAESLSPKSEKKRKSKKSSSSSSSKGSSAGLKESPPSDDHAESRKRRKDKGKRSSKSSCAELEESPSPDDRESSRKRRKEKGKERMPGYGLIY
jgi:hypothetical protein